MSELRSVEDRFGELIELGSARLRAEYLTRIGADDIGLRKQLEELWEAHQRAGSFLDDDGLDSKLAADSRTNVGTQIGPYKLRERLGSGGMDVVWAAEQKRPLKRKVALKLIKPGMDSEQVIARLNPRFDSNESSPQS